MRITRQREREKTRWKEEEKEEKENERREGGDEGEGTLWAVIPIFTMSQKGRKFLVMEFLVRRSRTWSSSSAFIHSLSHISLFLSPYSSFLFSVHFSSPSPSLFPWLLFVLAKKQNLWVFNVCFYSLLRSFLTVDLNSYVRKGEQKSEEERDETFGFGNPKRRDRKEIGIESVGEWRREREERESDPLSIKFSASCELLIEEWEKSKLNKVWKRMSLLLAMLVLTLSLSCFSLFVHLS